MRYSIYGRFVIEIVRQDGRWRAFRPGSSGVKRPERDLVIPAHLSEADLPGYLDDVYHEWARPGRAIEPLD